uniref:Uncharacterized protein n=1 Tax=Avena sativa TaxID=4498 RepID=A0ACD5ZI64_AVESA
MMAGGSAYFAGDLAAAAGWTAGGGYSASSGHGGVPQQYFVHNDGGGAPSACATAIPDAGSGVYGGMDRPTSFAGYDGSGGGGAPMAMAAPARPPPPPPRARATGALSKASWTAEEDEALTEAVRNHGHEHRKWATIARSLPRRTGKQCRERWINHMDPGIQQNKMWTEAEDRELIAAHKSCGNRWSVIARKLSGRSENSVKNHWNATRRSLKSKRMLKKRNCEQPPPGQLSVLAEYIRSLEPDIEWPPAVLPAAEPAPPTEPDHQTQQVGPDTAVAAAAAPLAYAAPDMAGMYSVDDMQHSWSPDIDAAAAAGYPYYIPPYSQPNYHLPYVPPPSQMISDQDLQAYASTNNVNPFADQQINLQPEAEMDRGSSTRNQIGDAGGGASGWCYFGADGSAGPSRSGSGGGPDDIDVVQLASREFDAADQYILDHLTRF